ncbi:hypothetical protein ILUMI_05185 [Ignelater luminosus]|uniref:SCA7 domain-containing protein n=1 Tax=Ignelater luminosus TaxID=2038154 RepID=A0A8K0DBH4_IGNLU|nr:hypothetical protein ILUMI_05185 [Ignelater luminosus]
MGPEDQRITLWSLEGDEHSVLQVLPQQIMPIDKQLNKIEKKQSRHPNRKSKSIKYYSPDIHCGVQDSEGEPCMNVITCLRHKIYEKYTVSGRSKSLKEIIRNYKKKVAIKFSKIKFKNGKLYNPDKHCGVKDCKGYPCLRTITCNVHTIAEKQKVRKRSKNIKALLTEYIPKKPKKSRISNKVRTVRVDIEQLLDEDIKKEDDDISTTLGKYAIIMFKN